MSIGICTVKPTMDTYTNVGVAMDVMNGERSEG